MLAGQLIHTPLERLAEPEIVPVEGQDVLADNRAIHPFRQGDFQIEHPAVECLAGDLGFFDQAENPRFLDTARLNVGPHGRSAQAGEGVGHQPIAFAAGLPVGGDEHVIGLQAHRAARFLALVHLRDELRNTVDQYVLVVDRRQPLTRGDNLDDVAVMLIAPHPVVGLGRERENRMLHRGHVVLGDGVENIADE